MTKFVLIISILVLFSCAGNENRHENNPANETTEISFDENTHDFGQLKSGEIVVYSFVFNNSGKHNLMINNAIADCGCVQVNFPQEPIKPGEKGIVEVEFDSSGLFGKHLKSIEISANCKEPKHLVIFAEVKNEQIEINY